MQRFLDLPNIELQRALAVKNPFRRAKGVEKALMLAFSIFASLRAKNLRSLRLDHNLRRAGDRLFIELFEDETKTHAPLTLEMPEELIGLLDLFVEKHRPLLPGADGPYLFPGENGGPRSYSAIRDAVGVHVGKLTGITISPHLYRHAVAKIVVERRPELAFDVSRRLGHKKMNTTYQSYLGTETPAASRRINHLLQETAGKPSAAAQAAPQGQGQGAQGRPEVMKYDTRQLPLHEWPEADRIVFDKLFADGDIFDETVGQARHWRPATRKSNQKNYASWLGWLIDRGLLDMNVAPHERATPQNVRAYAAELMEGRSKRTVATYLIGLKCVLIKMAPQ